MAGAGFLTLPSFQNGTVPAGSLPARPRLRHHEPAAVAWHTGKARLPAPGWLPDGSPAQYGTLSDKNKQNHEGKASLALLTTCLQKNSCGLNTFLSIVVRANPP